jgi:hypothetical protein
VGIVRVAHAPSEALIDANASENLATMGLLWVTRLIAGTLEKVPDVA